MPIYHLIVFPLAAWARMKIDKIRKSFLWNGDETTNGGHRLVNWPTVNRPKDLRGLGVTDHDKFEELYDFSGFGKNGWMIPNLGWDLRFPTMKGLGFSLMPFRWEMERRHGSSTITRSMEMLLETLLEQELQNGV